MASQGPVRIAIVDDYDVVVQGLARMFEPMRDRIQVVEVSANQPGVERVDIALIDSFALTRDVNEVLAEANAERYVFYSWSLEPELIETWTRFGTWAFLDKRLTAEGTRRRAPTDPSGRERRYEPRIIRRRPMSTWATGPVASTGSVPVRSEVIALITLDKAWRTSEIAGLMFMSINTVKTYIRTAYRKIGVDSRPRVRFSGVSTTGSALTTSRAKAPDKS